MKHVAITSAITLTNTQIKSIQSALHINADDQILFSVDPTVIGGLKVIVDGHALDLTVKRQLAVIEQE